MLISCPNCATNFSVPDKALAPSGRTLKCAKCGHKWFQTASRPEDDFGLDESSFPPPPLRPAAEQERRPMFSAPDPDLDFDAAPPPISAAAARASADLDVDLDEPPYHNFGAKPRNDSFGTDLDLDGASEPIPDVFANKPKTKSGTGGLWFLLFVLLLGGAAGGAYYFQDKVIDLWPPAHDILTNLQLRREKPGAGLELRNAGTPERFVQNDTEVLIVRGIIANISDRERPVPTMKLVLLDRDKAVVQEKQSPPPVTSLDPGGTAGFRIILERPDANAVEVNVLFVDPHETAK
ncbi:MAG: zinc-ribbon domain-containing protein [Rhodospirillaceae bacterium]|nr:zinc-ribbon domain-containing protein [Rhodospirillales bacterium]